MNGAGPQQAGLMIGAGGGLQGRVTGGVGDLPAAKRAKMGMQVSPFRPMDSAPMPSPLGGSSMLSSNSQAAHAAAVAAATAAHMASQGQHPHSHMKLEPSSLLGGGSASSSSAAAAAAAAAGAGGERKLIAAEDCTSLVEAFTVEQIELHLQSLQQGMQLTSARVKTYVAPLVKALQEHQFGWVFNNPVDPEALGLPDYFNIVKNPMDLGTVKKYLDSGRYHTLEDCAYDVRLTFQNAMSYNLPGSEVYPVAEEMLRIFEAAWAKLLRDIAEDEEGRKRNGEACTLCSLDSIKYEPMTYYCNGVTCAGNRIRRNSHFYTGGVNQFHWCTPCYQELKDNEPIHVGEIVLSKRELVRKKNDEVQEEPWVECTTCRMWVHQLCALFNQRKNTHVDRPYYCPNCILNTRRSTGQLGPTSAKLGGRDLPHTPFSRFLEDRVNERLQRCYEEDAQQRGVPLAAIPPANPIHVKQVSSQEVTHLVKPNFAKRYAARGFPEEFAARSKCVLLFQELDGVDCLLFGMYVYEYGHACAAPNQRRVYVSYLDSVYYFRPRQYRTVVYKEIIVAYLDYVKGRGFHTAHIWACPPLKGDDYILYCHPEDQKTPKDDRLQQW
jgi:E1A/CREB-binding protein